MCSALVATGFPREGLLGEVSHDSFVQGREGFQFGGGEQFDKVLADALDMRGCRTLNGAAASGK